MRISPYEIHIMDSDWYDELYTGPQKRRNKWEWSAKMFGNSLSAFGTIDHDHHRLRRAAISPFFSQRAVTVLEPQIVEIVESLSSRCAGFRETKEPMNLGHGFAALTMDVITEYCYAKTYDCVNAPDFSPVWGESIMELSKASHLLKQFGILIDLINFTPEWFIAATNPPLMFIGNFKKEQAKQISQYLYGTNKDHESASHPTIFHEILQSDLPPSEKSLTRLADEGQTLVGAGQVTTAHYLRVLAFHLIDNPEKLNKLKEELKTAMPDANMLLPWQKLEQLPYLNAVIQEGFRMSYGIPHRLQRISPDAPLTYKEWLIPAGTPVSMSAIFMHDDPKHFPNPKEFRPERWLNPASRERLENYLCNFSRGTRMCLGFNLARAEIYLAVAALFRRFEFELFETERDDVDLVHDYFNPAPRKGSQGLRVIVR